MKTQIENENEFNKTIDQYGEALTKIARLKKDADVLKMLIEAFAIENDIRSHATERYELTMKKSAPALRISPDMKEEDVMAELRRSETGRAYVIESYDAAGLKRDFGKNREGRDMLASMGFYLTTPHPHAEVRGIQV